MGISLLSSMRNAGGLFYIDFSITDCKKIARDSEANVEEKRRGFSGFSNGFPKFPMRSSEAAAKTAWRFPNITIALFEETIYNQR
ncbi:MAG: hypothetical protein PUD44_11965 [Clostridiaceae bacterium]|nr:hypothetical protein [Clostridiaceae bacterium]